MTRMENILYSRQITTPWMSSSSPLPVAGPSSLNTSMVKVRARRTGIRRVGMCSARATTTISAVCPIAFFSIHDVLTHVSTQFGIWINGLQPRRKRLVLRLLPITRLHTAPRQ